jgi:hypothetical protein
MYIYVFFLILKIKGGACWTKHTTSDDFCTSDADVAKLHGAFNREDPTNPFQNFTIVHILYCSGDLHGGNVTRAYTDSAGVPVQQMGYFNSKSAIDWINVNFDYPLHHLVLSGCSAGSLGVQAWAGVLLDMLEYEHAAVTPDSYMGVFPDGSQGPLIKEYGMCSVGVFEPKFMEACLNETLTIQDVFDDAIATNPGVAFANLNSKADSTQMAYYTSVAASFHDLPLYLTSAEFENAVNVILERYNKNENYVSYLVTGTQHCFLPYNLMMTTDTTGVDGEGLNGQMTLADWLGKFPVDSKQSVGTECDGEELTEENWSGDSYCDAGQQGKVYTAV